MPYIRFITERRESNMASASSVMTPVIDLPAIRHSIYNNKHYGMCTKIALALLFHFSTVILAIVIYTDNPR